MYGAPSRTRFSQVAAARRPPAKHDYFSYVRPNVFTPIRSRASLVLAYAAASRRGPISTRNNVALGPVATNDGNPRLRRPSAKIAAAPLSTAPICKYIPPPTGSANMGASVESCGSAAGAALFGATLMAGG